MRKAYAAPFELTPGVEGWLVVEQGGDGLRRAKVPSDWLVAQAAAHRSGNTMRSKAESVAQWWEWCHHSHVDPLRANGVAFSRFIIALQSVPKGYALNSDVRGLPGSPGQRQPTTVRLRVIYIKALYRWALRSGLVSSATASSIEACPTPSAPQRRHAKRLSPEQVKVLLAGEFHPRDRYLIEVIYGCGLREGEAMGLMVEDLCMTSEIADIFGCDLPRQLGAHLHVRPRPERRDAAVKGGLPRAVPLPHRVVQAIRGWQAWAFDNAPEAIDCPYMAVSLAGPTRGKPLSTRGFLTAWDTKVRVLPGLRNASPHLLRHTYASELIDAGCDRFVLQELLGHRRIESTEIYTHALARTMTDAVNRLCAWREATLGLTR